MSRSICTALLLLPLVFGCAHEPSGTGKEAVEKVGRDPSRWRDNGDGTVLDTKTGLVWEKKTGNLRATGKFVSQFALGFLRLCAKNAVCDDPHDFRNSYTWSSGKPWNPDGTLYTMFLAKLNEPPCFADHCDWRIPTKEELSSVPLIEYECVEYSPSSGLAPGGHPNSPTCGQVKFPHLTA